MHNYATKSGLNKATGVDNSYDYMITKNEGKIPSITGLATTATAFNAVKNTISTVDYIYIYIYIYINIYIYIYI